MKTGEKSRYSITSLDTLCGGLHGHYEQVRDEKAVICYIAKDGDYCTWTQAGPGTLDVNLCKSQKRKKQVNTYAQAEKLLCAGADHECIMRELPGFLLRNLSSVVGFASIAAAHQEALDKLEWKPVENRDEWNDKERAVADWVNVNFNKPSMPFKGYRSPQLYLWGPPACGKTMLVRWLTKFFRCWHAPTGEAWFNAYHDSMYDFAFFDEFDGSTFSITTMNQFLDGSQNQLKQKGTYFCKRKNLPVIICSNLSPEECFPKAPKNIMKAFLSRLLVVELTDEAKLDIDDYACWINEEHAQPRQPIDMLVAAMEAEEDADEEKKEVLDLCTPSPIHKCRKLSTPELLCLEGLSQKEQCDVLAGAVQSIQERVRLLDQEERKLEDFRLPPAMIDGPFVDEEAYHDEDDGREMRILSEEAARQGRFFRSMKACKFLVMEAEED